MSTVGGHLEPGAALGARPQGGPPRPLDVHSHGTPCTGTAARRRWCWRSDRRRTPERVRTAAEAKPNDRSEHVDDRPGHDLRYDTDSSELRHQTDWRRRYGDKRVGLQATIEGYAANHDWCRRAEAPSECK